MSAPPEKQDQALYTKKVASWGIWDIAAPALKRVRQVGPWWVQGQPEGQKEFSQRWALSGFTWVNLFTYYGTDTWLNNSQIIEHQWLRGKKNTGSLWIDRI